MSVARRRAIGLRNQVGLVGPLTDEALEGLLIAHGLAVESFPFVGGIVELWHGRGVVLSNDLGRPERRWLVAHGLGHHLLHRGSRFRMTRASLGKLERQAELFAGWLHLADTWKELDAWELAEYHVLPEDRVIRWLQLLSGTVAVPDGWT